MGRTGPGKRFAKPRKRFVPAAEGRPSDRHGTSGAAIATAVVGRWVVVVFLLSAVVGHVVRPAVLVRALSGLLGRAEASLDDVPDHLRPSRHLSLARGAATRRLGPVLKVLSYNVKRAERLDQVAASLTVAVAEHVPELVLLQEAPIELVQASGVAEAVTCRDLVWAPFHHVERPDSTYRYRRYGQIIASSAVIRSHRVVELPTVNSTTLGRGHTMKRIALVAELETADGRRAVVVNVHLEPFVRPAGRLPQYEALLAAVETAPPADVILLCGDFNPTLLQRTEPGERRLSELGFENALARRWRVLDTCFVRGHRRLVDTRTLRLGGSDHRPVLFRIAL